MFFGFSWQGYIQNTCEKKNSELLVIHVIFKQGAIEEGSWMEMA